MWSQDETAVILSLVWSAGVGLGWLMRVDRDRELDRREHPAAMPQTDPGKGRSQSRLARSPAGSSSSGAGEA